MNPTVQRKPPAKRLFTGTAGSPLAKISKQPEPASALAETQVQSLMDRVAVANTDEQVRQVVHETFQAPKKRGRPRVYDPTTLKQRDREYKRRQRLIANHEIAAYLRHWDLGLDSKIPPGLKTRYGIEVDAFRELLADDKIEAKVLKEIGRDLKMIGAIPNPSPVNKIGLPLMSSGKFMTEAPAGKGELVTSSKTGVIYDIREHHERELSKPDDQDPSDPFDMPGSTLGSRDKLPKGDRRRVTPSGSGPDDEE